MEAFKSTLEELGDADLLLHVVDVAQTQSFANTSRPSNASLANLGLGDKPEMLVFNKMDLMSEHDATILAHQYRAVPVSAEHGTRVDDLVKKLTHRLSDPEKMASLHSQTLRPQQRLQHDAEDRIRLQRKNRRHGGELKTLRWAGAKVQSDLAKPRRSRPCLLPTSARRPRG